PSNLGELYISTPASGGGVDIEVFRVGLEDSVRHVVRLPGTLRLLVIDPAGVRAAALTDQGVIRFGPRDGNPQGTVSALGLPARDIAFATDGTLFVLQETALIAIDPSGVRRWSIQLVDGRRVLAGKRAIVLDGTERLIAVDPVTGALDELGVGGTVQDLAVSPDGTKIAVLSDARRAVTFTLP
ncbi:MAG TPA: hypothetical protein VFM93_13585, partial [Candidatus Limnocylindria bacterium]|nr:hypothetical protein [Candidatus Limnocylindria bacterium]